MLTFTPQHSDLQREQLLETVRLEPLDDKEIYTLLADLPAPLPLPGASIVTMPDDLQFTYRCQHCHHEYQIDYRLTTIVALSAAGVPTALLRRCAQYHRLYRDGEVHSCE